MITRPCGDAIEYHYRQLGQWETNNPDIRTSSKDGVTYTIDHWSLGLISQPSDATIETFIDEYENYLNNILPSEETALKTKMNLSNAEIKTLKKVLS